MIAVQALQGTAFAVVRISASVYVERIAPAGMRARAQGLVAFISEGIGLFVGAPIAGLVAQSLAPDWKSVWLVPAAGTLLVWIAYLVAFRPEEKK
jgi:NHS family xanthosine MFS transporter